MDWVALSGHCSARCFPKKSDKGSDHKIDYVPLVVRPVLEPQRRSAAEAGATREAAHDVLNSEEEIPCRQVALRKRLHVRAIARLRRTSMKSKIMLAVAVGVLSMVGVGLASADITTTAQFRGSFPFTLTGGPSPACPMLPTGFVIQGNVDYFNVLNTRVDANGVTHYEFASSETGSATDSNGATYRINYHNHQSESVGPSGYPIILSVENDHFNLVGNGLATQLQMHFVIRLTFLSPSDPGTLTVVNVHGDPFDCDVI
jgi:hypothetical protein